MEARAVVSHLQERALPIELLEWVQIQKARQHLGRWGPDLPSLSTFWALTLQSFSTRGLLTSAEYPACWLLFRMRVTDWRPKEGRRCTILTWSIVVIVFNVPLEVYQFINIHRSGNE